MIALETRSKNKRVPTREAAEHITMRIIDCFACGVSKDELMREKEKRIKDLEPGDVITASGQG